MISYEAYKILHLFMIMVTVSAMGGVIAEGRWIPNKSFKIAIALMSFFIFVGGMGLIARLGFKHGEAFPLWVYVKIAMWIVFNVALVLLFKVQHKKYKMLCAAVSFIAVFVAVYTAVTKLA